MINYLAASDGNDNNSGAESYDETELKSTLDAISKDENLLPALKWLKTCLNDEKEDREEDDENIADMPLVPILEECTSAMELPDFVKLLSVTKLSAPNDQEQYWRIPATLSAKALAEKCTFIQNIIDMEIDDINFESILGKSGKTKSYDKNMSSKPKKKEKRGPNKWMPIRRAVDSEVAQRISEAAGVKEKEESPPPKSGKKKPGKGGGNKKTPNRRKIVKNDSSSDEENNEKEKGSDSGSDDGNDASSKQQVNSPVFKSAIFIENSSSNDEENQTPSRGKSRENKAKRRVMNSSSSDEAVDDPSPMPSQNVRIF